VVSNGEERPGTVTSSAWPALPLSEWSATRDTLQLWTQVIGKLRQAHSPLLNHWWNVALYVIARGLTTSLMWTSDGRPDYVALSGPRQW
jgi:hypothetical protein